MKKLLLIALLFISSNCFAAGFNAITSTDGNFVIAVGNSGNLFRSVDGGTTWAKYTIASYNFTCVTSFQSAIWIGSDNGKVYKTSAGTAPLTEYSLPVSGRVNSICFTDANNGWLCGENFLFKSTNGGLNWTNVSAQLPNAKYYSISFKDGLNGIIAGESIYDFITSDGGATWNITAFSPFSNVYKKAKYFSDGIVLVGPKGALAFKDGANTFRSVNTKINTDVTGVSGTSVMNAHICGGGGFIRNNAGPNAYYQNFEPSPMLANLVDICYFNSSKGWAVSSLNDAIIRTTDGGVTWNFPSGTNAVYSWQNKLTATGSIGNTLCQHPLNRDAMFVVYNTGVYASYNRGENWALIKTMSIAGSTISRCHSFYVSPLDTNIWVAAVESTPDKVIYSSDYGTTWSTSIGINFSAYGQPLEMDQNNPSTFYYVPDGGGFYKSTNSGASFTQISAFPFISPCDIVVMYDSANVLYLGESSPSRIYKSTNSGVNWSLSMTYTSGSEIPSIANSTFDKTIAYASTFSSPIYKTSNYGDNWTNILTLGSSGWGSDLCHEDPNLYAVGTYGGATCFSTMNNGASFSTSSIGGGSGAGFIYPERGYLFAQQTSNLYKFYANYTVATTINEHVDPMSMPQSFTLYQNLPNPFNPETKIKFDLSQSGNITLDVYNQLGQLIKNLSSGFRTAGSYEVQFDGSGLSSGIYFYRLTSPGGVQTKKMFLVK